MFDEILKLTKKVGKKIGDGRKAISFHQTDF